MPSSHSHLDGVISLDAYRRGRGYSDTLSTSFVDTAIAKRSDPDPGVRQAGLLALMNAAMILPATPASQKAIDWLHNHEGVDVVPDAAIEAVLG